MWYLNLNNYRQIVAADSFSLKCFAELTEFNEHDLKKELIHFAGVRRVYLSTSVKRCDPESADEDLVDENVRPANEPDVLQRQLC